MKRVYMAVLSVLLLVGCNKSVVDLTYKFDRAMIKLQDGSCIEVEVSSWLDYEDGDQIQITSKEGVTYLVHSSNVTLISD
ncbi:MAG: hypothetical protein IJP28_06920 [Erysipelotrichales bacterium]|nr:hypothetical protein [Erysipelotrichales bacterium]MBR3693200.1 hypothetical protein [Erysipelotrichales bacterium]